MRFKLYENNSHTGPKISTSVNLSVLDENETRPELIGTVEIDLTKAYKSPPNVGYDNWHQLLYQGKYAGEIFLEITFYPARPPLPSLPPGYNQQIQQQLKISPKQQQQVIQSGIRNKKYASETQHDFYNSVSKNRKLNNSVNNVSHGTNNMNKVSCNNNNSNYNSYNNYTFSNSNGSMLSATSTSNFRPLPQQPYQRVVEPEPEPEPEPAMFIAPARSKSNIFQPVTSAQMQHSQSSYIYHTGNDNDCGKNKYNHRYYNGGKIIGLPKGIRYAPVLETKMEKTKNSPNRTHQQQRQPFLKFPEVPYEITNALFSEQRQQQSLHNVAPRNQPHIRSPVLTHSPRMSGSIRSNNSDLDTDALSFFSSPLPDAGRECSSLASSTNSSIVTDAEAGDKAKKNKKMRIPVKRKPVSDPSTSAATASGQIMFSPEDYGTESPLTPTSPLLSTEETDRLDESTYAPQPVFLKVSTRTPLPTTAAELIEPGLSQYSGEGQWNLTSDHKNKDSSKPLVGNTADSAYTCSTAPLVTSKTTISVSTTGDSNRRNSTVRRKPRLPPKVPIGMSPEEFIATEFSVYEKADEDDGLRYINPV